MNSLDVTIKPFLGFNHTIFEKNHASKATSVQEEATIFRYRREIKSMEAQLLAKEVICVHKKKRQRKTTLKAALLPVPVFFKGKKIRASETEDAFLKRWL